MDCGQQAPGVVGMASLRLAVICPANAVTGGPEAVHQLVDAANMIEPGSAAMCYVPYKTNHTVTPAYRHYNIPIIQKHEIPADALVVLPEIWPEYAYEFQQRCALWWLSVDNYGAHAQTDLTRIDLNLCQSDYAYQHTAQYPQPRMMLTDYINTPTIKDSRRYQQIVLNPAKNAGLLGAFQATTRHPIIELRNLDRYGVARTFAESSIYIDFGHHPGRDRPPREAAHHGCVLFTTPHGAAGYPDDMPLDPWFFFHTLDELHDKVNHLFNSKQALQEAQNKQAPYREWIDGQKNVFINEVGELLESL
jgi:hypothetical protein